MSVFIGYPSFMAYQMIKGKDNKDGFPSIPGMIARYSALSLTNEQMAENPVWKDLTGNGYDLQMKNFAWSGMSGVDGYEYNFLSSDWEVGKVQLSEALSYKITIVDKKNSVQLFKYIRNESENTIKITLKVTGIEINGCTLRVYDNASMSHTQDYKKDGIYQINYTATEGSDKIYFYVYGGNMGQLDNPITIEQLPIYPGALVFDGVDDWGVCDNFPILTKEKGYTVVALRKWLTPETKTINEALLGNFKNNPIWTSANFGAFQFEVKYNGSKKVQTDSFGIGNNITLNNNPLFSYQISNSYNGSILRLGSNVGGNFLTVGCGGDRFYANAAIWELVFLDHDATEEELTKIKDYFVKTYPWFFPDQAWTVTGKTNEDEDRATIANITGNGNDFVLSNFGFAEGSGYGLYGQNYISYAITNRAIYTKTNSSIHVTKSITAGANFTESTRDVTIPSYRIKVTGIQSGQEMIYRGSNNTFLTNIPSDGIYVLPAVEKGSNLGFQFVSYTGDCDIIIEQIPEYEGYLVTDGVDDKVESSRFTLNKDWTIVGNWTMLSNIPSNCGIIIESSMFLYNSLDGITIYFTGGSPIKIQSKSVNAFCSDGRIYLNDWQEIRNNIEQEATISKGVMAIGYFNRDFTKMAFKNLGIYNNQLLSKDDCIKAYNYLQTLKAK